MPPTNPSFTVDTHIFRELGELLVGRDSTALLELIKNSYDADATRVVVTALHLNDSRRGQIVIQDNGSGMDAARFASGFLRIASRFKEEGERRSFHFKRRYTGSKGIGRLAAHKLAKYMEIDSVRGEPKGRSRDSIQATIDWERIEAQPTLDQLTDEIDLEEVSLPKPVATGTTITLRRLRRLWGEREKTRFIAECRAFQVPGVLQNPLPPRVFGRPLLFSRPVVRDGDGKDPGCEIVLEGEFSEGDSYWEPLIDLTNWVLEMDCLTDKRKIRYAIGPSKATAHNYAQAQRHEFEHDHPSSKEGPFFQARILIRDQQIRDKPVLDWSRQTSGIRVYMEGFRVLPYGDARDDWLGIEANYSRRSWETDPLFDSLIDRQTDEAGDWQLSVLSNKSYTGAIFLTQNGAPTLRMLVNREGFVADPAYDRLVDIVRRGLDLAVRTRAAATYPERQKRKDEKRRSATGEMGQDEHQSPRTPEPTATPNDGAGAALTIAGTTAGAINAVREARELLSAGTDPAAVANQLKITQSAIDQIGAPADRVGDSAAMFRILASLGTQMAAFVHEINSLLGNAVAVHESIDRLRVDRTLPPTVRTKIGHMHRSVGDLRRQIERQAAFLIDLTSTDARRRRSRQPLAERFASAARLVARSIEKREITLNMEIPQDIKSPPMFAAELTAVFANLLTNAVKAAGRKGVIRVRNRTQVKSGTVLVLENTGAAVDLAEAERWFLPFESTTAEVDSTLGQGMGLGLTITRDILDQYGATVRFVAPSAEFATAVEIVFPA